MDAENDAIDVRDMPELARLAERVRDSNRPWLSCRGSERLARVVPLTPRRPRRRVRSKADLDAFLTTAGGWKDVDVDAFLVANRQSRDLSTRPPVEL